MALSRIARFTNLSAASYFLAGKARELAEHSQILPSDMIFLTHAADGLRTIAIHLMKHKLPFRSLDKDVDEVAAICEFVNMQPDTTPRKCCFVLLSIPLHEYMSDLCHFLHNSEVEQTHLSICLDADVDSDTLSFQLDAELSPLVGAIEFGVVYFRKHKENWHCEWADRPAWMIPHLLVEICSFLANHQRAFLENGAKHIVPLKMSEVAASVGCHATSVSRAISDVDAQTEWGRFLEPI